MASGLNKRTYKLWIKTTSTYFDREIRNLNPNMYLRWNSECMAETLTGSIICQCIMTQNFSAFSEVTCRKSETRQLAEDATKNPNGFLLITVLWVQSISSSYYQNIIFVNISNLLSTAMALVLQKQQTLFFFFTYYKPSVLQLSDMKLCL